jgi:nucleotide-binding universal stress UspA family protein
MARLFHANAEAIHVGADRRGDARSLAETAHVKLRVVEEGSARELIAAADEDDDVVAMVVGARGLPVARRPVGSTARAVILELKKPLVVVPPQARTGAIGRVLVPLDGSHASATALASTFELAVAASLVVVVLHVHHGGSVPRFCDQTQHETEAWSDEFLARNCPRARDVKLELRAGVPGESVVEVAAKEHVDLVAMCWSQDLSPDHAAVVREVLERCPVPVLLVPVGRPR